MSSQSNASATTTKSAPVAASSTTKSVPFDASSTYTTSTTYSYEKPLIASTTKAKPSFASRTKKFLSFGEPPCAEYDRAHPKVLSEAEKEARKIEYPPYFMSGQVRGLH